MCLINKMVKYTRRRITRRRRRVQRRLRRNTIPRGLTQGKIYSFKRTCQMKAHYFDGVAWVQASGNEITNNSAIPYSSGIFKFRLEDVPNATDFTQLYEQFKITGVKLRFIPFYGTESSSAGSILMTPLATCIDRGANDQILASPSFNSMLENQDVKVRSTQRGFAMWIGTPTFHQPADGLAQGAYKSGWLDSEIVTSRNVDYHGVKWAWQSTFPVERACSYQVFATYYIKCRNPQ